jgi:hypothetical protein
MPDYAHWQGLPYREHAEPGVLYPDVTDNSRAYECGKIVSFSCCEKGTTPWHPICCLTVFQSCGSGILWGLTNNRMTPKC